MPHLRTNMSQERRQYRRIPLEASLSFQELSFHANGAGRANNSYMRSWIHRYFT